MLGAREKSAQRTSLGLSDPSLAVERIPSLDLIKWLAFITMFIDHLRFISPQLGWCFYLGRISFPCFCFLIASHMQRKLDSGASNRQIIMYLSWLSVFFIISEYPYRLFIVNAKSYNVLLTLFLSVLLIGLVTHKSWLIKALCIPVILATVLLGHKVMYGLTGVLLPLAILLTLRHGVKLIALPLALAMVANINIQKILDAGSIHLNILLAMLLASTGLLIAFFVHANVDAKKIPKINRWGYLIYPIHFFVFYAIKTQVG